MTTIAERQRRLVFDVLAARALGEVATVLQAAAIPCIPVKGVVLARWLYGDLAERPYVDVDLLVTRAAFERAVALIDSQRWPVFYRSTEMGELGFHVGQIPVELHAEVGRRDLSLLTVEAVLARAMTDTTTFPFAIARLDDVDHFLLVVLNVVKDGFTYANPHQPDDLERLLERLSPRRDELITRAHAAGLTTALHLTARWMERTRGSTAWSSLRADLPPAPRRLFLAAARLHGAVDQRRDNRLAHAGALLGLAMATQVPDDRRLRWSGLRRVLKRGAARKLGRNPDLVAPHTTPPTLR